MTMKREDYIDLEDYLRSCHEEALFRHAKIWHPLPAYYAKLMLAIHGDGSDEDDQ